MDEYDGYDEDEYDDESYLDSLTLGDIFSIAEETAGLDYANSEYQQDDRDAYIYKTPEGETMGPTSEPYDTYTPAGETMGPQRSGGGGGGIFGDLQDYAKQYKDVIGMGVMGLAWLDKNISDRSDASQAADAAEMQRNQTAQEKRDAIALAGTKSDTDWEREKERIKLSQDFTTATNKQAQLDRLELAAFNKSSSGGGGGGGGGFDPAAARAARVSASIVGMKPTKTGIVNSNIWGNALNTLQRK